MRKCRKKLRREDIETALASGLSVDEIASVLDITPRTFRCSAGKYGISIPGIQSIPLDLLEAVAYGRLSRACLAKRGYDKGLINHCLREVDLWDTYLKNKHATLRGPKPERCNPNAAYKRKQDKYTDFVVCPVCGKKLQRLSSWHLSKHGMTRQQLLVKYPGTNMIANRLRKLYHDTMKNTNKYIWSTPAIATRCLEALTEHHSTFGVRSGIPCSYVDRKGRTIKLRSRLELAACIQLDLMDINYEYEPQWIHGSSRRYLPDFYLPDMGVYLEIKHSDRLQAGNDRIDDVQSALDHPVMLWTEHDLLDGRNCVPKCDAFDTIKYADLLI